MTSLLKCLPVCSSKDYFVTSFLDYPFVVYTMNFKFATGDLNVCCACVLRYVRPGVDPIKQFLLKMEFFVIELGHFIAYALFCYVTNTGSRLTSEIGKQRKICADRS